VAQALQENKDLTTLMNHPKIDKENKIQLIEDIFKGQVSGELVGLMRMIVEKDHYRELQSVFTYFIDRVKEYRNIGTAYVTSAVELSAAQKAAVEKKLLATTKYVQFEMHYDVDAGLIGGMVIRIGDRVVDSSIRTKLYDLTRELSQIQLKVGECAP
jgi:F-type H+-transporting ATPase subunit delta